MKEIKEYCIGDLFYEEASIDSLKEIKQDGVKVQEYLERSTATIITKAHNLFRILLIIASALLGFVISKGDDWNLIVVVAAISALVFVCVLLLLYRVAYGVDTYLSSGTQPEFVLEDDIFKFDNSEKNYKELLRFNIQNIQREIQSNLKTHEKLVERFKIANLVLIVILLALPIILAIISY